MARNDGRVERGQKLAAAFSARAWNRAQDAADLVLAQQAQFGGDSPQSLPPASNIVFVRNNTGSTVERFGVIGIGGPLTNLATSNGIVVDGVMPAAYGSFAIPMEPIEHGKIGRCACGGVFPVRVSICSDSHLYANPKDNDLTQLYSSTVGLLQILSRGSPLCVGSM